MNEGSQMESIDLCVPIYINQEVVFGLLATLHDGFSTLKTIHTSTSDKEATQVGVGGGIGVSNVFGLFGISFGGKRDKTTEAQDGQSVSEEKVHTPISLFAVLRRTLTEKGLVQKVDSPAVLNQLRSGSFVEFTAILRKNPVVDVLETVMQLGNMYKLMSSTPGSKKGQSSSSDTKKMLQQVQAMLDGLTQHGSLEVIAEMLPPKGMRAVLSTKVDFFANHNADEIVDGEFHVLGKVMRVIQEGSEEEINLLRKTSFGRLKMDLLHNMFTSFAGATEFVDIPVTTISIPGPAIQVMPIGLFT